MSDNPGAAFGRRLREARQARGLTQMQLHAVSGLEQATISKYERGDVESPSARKIAVLSSALHVSMEWLTTGAGPGVGSDHIESVVDGCAVDEVSS